MAEHDSTVSISSIALENQSPDAIRQRLAGLIARYAQTRSPKLAGSIVRHIEAICMHPRFDGDGEDLCDYLRLKTHWRWLANPVVAVEGTR